MAKTKQTYRMQKFGPSSTSFFPSHCPPPSPDGRDRLTILPSEVLSSIFALVPAKQAPGVPICKALLPFQRRRYETLRFPDDLDVDRAKLLLSRGDNLEHLALPLSDAVPALLESLSKPEKLLSLRIVKASSTTSRDGASDNKPPVFDGSLATSLASLYHLETLELDCPVDFSDIGLVTMMHQTRLETLRFSKETASTLRLDHLLPLVSAVTKLPFLQQLVLDFTFAEDGGLAAENNPKRPEPFYDCWVLPEWPEQFPRTDLEFLIRASKVRVEGTAVEAMELEDIFEVESKEMRRMIKEQRQWERDSYPRKKTYNSEGETEEDEEDSDDDDYW